LVFTAANENLFLPHILLLTRTSVLAFFISALLIWVFFQLSCTGQTWCVFVAVPCRSISCRRLIFLYLLTDFSTGLLTTQSRASRSAPQSRPFPLAAKAEARHSFSLTIFWVLSFPGGWFSSAHSVSWLFLLAAGLIWFPGFTCDSHTSQRQCKLCVLLIE
jgi:hypothetical protein